MMIFTEIERREFLDSHIPHRLTAWLSTIRRQQVDHFFFQGKGDIYRSAIEGTYIMTRVFIEFLGVESQRKGTDLILAPRARTKQKSSKKARDTDVMLDCFGLPLASPSDFSPHEALIARVHDGLSKSTAHFTFKTESFFDAGEDLIPAIKLIYGVLLKRFFEPLKELPKFHVDFPK
jgi:hypothetical protein